MQNMAKKHSYIDAASYCDQACSINASTLQLVLKPQPLR